MSEVIDAAVTALTAKLSDGFDGVAKFVIPGEGAIMVDADGVRAGDDEADVTLTAERRCVPRDSGGRDEPDHGLHDRQAVGRRHHGPGDETWRGAGVSRGARFYADAGRWPRRRARRLAEGRGRRAHPRRVCGGMAGDAGTVLLLPGRTEYVEKYGRAAGDLARARLCDADDRLARSGAGRPAACATR